MSVLEMVEPRFATFPEAHSSAGREAIGLCEMAGLFLDPWEAFVLEHGLGETENGRWAAFEVGLVVGRQNGKNTILEARELAGLFLLGEKLIIHSAHQFDTSLEAFKRLLTLIEETPDLDSRVAKVSWSHGQEGITLKNGQRIRFRTRTKGGARGFTADCVIMDEAMDLPESFHGALLPTLSAKSVHGNPQVWYAGSAVDQEVHDYGVVLARVRERGLGGDDPSLAYFEWSVGDPAPSGQPWTPDRVSEELAADEASWMAANPGFGIRISAAHIENERRSMDPRTFAVERLGVGDWPRTSGAESIISIELWKSLVDEDSSMMDPVCFAFDVSPMRTTSTVSAAGKRPDGLWHVEIIENRAGTDWIVEKIGDLTEKFESAGVFCAGSSPAASLIHEFEDRSIAVTPVAGPDEAKACGAFFDDVQQHNLRHLGQHSLTMALRGASNRPVGDAWAWSRKRSTSDITPLVSSTVALWGARTLEPAATPWIVTV